MVTPRRQAPKLFGRYHELSLLGVGFILTTVLGTLLGYTYQRRAWEYDRAARQYDARITSAAQGATR
jgi:hypothetical protein